MNDLLLHVVTGKIRTGKSTRLLERFSGNADVCGVLQIEEDGDRYFIELPSLRKIKMETDGNSDDDFFQLGNFKFSVKAFERANKILDNCISSNCKTIVIDEFGKLELQRKGFYEFVKKIIDLKKSGKLNRKIIIVVRDYLLDDFILMFGIKRDKILIEKM